MAKQYLQGKAVKIICENCDQVKIDDEPFVQMLVCEICRVINMTPLAGPFSAKVIKPEGNRSLDGVSAVLLIEESHIAAHCWTLDQAVRIVIDSCADFDIDNVTNYLGNVLRTSTIKVTVV
jgi:S-adenosylmethionine/arginine decarboxylase-like enzyme